MQNHSITKIDSKWQALHNHAKSQYVPNISDLFEEEADRLSQFSVSIDNFTLDASKNLIDGEAKELLLALARSTQLENTLASISDNQVDLLSDQTHKNGNVANACNRNYLKDILLHTHLRDISSRSAYIDKTDVKPWLLDQNDELCDFCENIRSGKITSSAGKKYTDVINLGVGSCGVGLRLINQALQPYCDGPNLHLITNIDGAQLADLLPKLDQETTLVVIATKTFNTSETIRNAQSVKAWMCDKLEPDQAIGNFVAATANPHTARAFGIPSNQIFALKEWVNYKYLLWSAAGISICLRLGKERYREFLAGANKMDNHFFRTNLDSNMPVLLALVAIWHRNILNYSSIAVCPYDYRLEHLPSYVRMIEMETNGKSINSEDKILKTHSAPMVWGGTGTEAQHQFMQGLHLGTDITPVDMIIGANPSYSPGEEIPAAENHHRHLIANCLAQSHYLMMGDKAEDSSENDKKSDTNKPEQTIHHGSRPSNIILYDKLTPHTLGMLMALYEHKSLVESILWDIKYGRTGVSQKGSKIARDIATSLRDKVDIDKLDPSTARIINKLLDLQHSDDTKK